MEAGPDAATAPATSSWSTLPATEAATRSASVSLTKDTNARRSDRAGSEPVRSVRASIAALLRFVDVDSVAPPTRLIV